MLRTLLLLATLLIGAGEAAAEKRLALVIGNSAYQHTAALRNPKNDAEDLTAALKRLGFEVMLGLEQDKRSMERTIRQFGLSLTGTDVALFFFAGHAIQVAGQNYILPIDARLSSENDVDFESIPLNLILKQMEREAKASLLLLDACRDNPLARNLARSMGTRSVTIGRGLAEVKTGVGTLIGFSTQPGNVALDGTGRNSPYTGALLKHIEAPGRDIGAMLINVRNDVVTATDGKQVPWEHTSLMGQIVFRPVTASIPVPPAPGGTVEKELELAFWNSIKDSKSPELLRAYIDRFPQGTFAGLARIMIDLAVKEQAAQQQVAQREIELKRVEDARLTAERQKVDAERKSDEAKHATELRKAQEEARKAREALNHAEREREQARASVEAAKEQQRIETSKLAAQVANIATIPPALLRPKTDVDADLVRKIKRELNRVGCEAGREDGEWDLPVITAIHKFNQAAETRLALEVATPEALRVVAAKTSRVCPLECRDGEKYEQGRCVAVAPSAPTKAPAPKTRPAEKAPAIRKGSDSADCTEWKRCQMLSTPLTRGRCGLQPLGC